MSWFKEKVEKANGIILIILLLYCALGFDFENTILLFTCNVCIQMV